MRKFPFTTGVSVASGGTTSISGKDGFRLEIYSIAVSVQPSGSTLNNTIAVSGLVDTTGSPGVFTLYLTRTSTAAQNFSVPVRGTTLSGGSVSFDMEPNDGDLNGTTLVVSGAFVEARGV